MHRCWTWIVVASLWVPTAFAGAPGTPPMVDQGVLGEALRAGRDLHQEGKLKEALGKFEEALKLDGENKLANQYAARINAQLGQFRPAADTLRKLQRLGVSLVNEDMQKTLKLVLDGVLALENLKERGDLLIHVRETIQGLPVGVERQLDAHLMAIYAKLGEQHLHDIVKNRYFGSPPIPGDVYFMAAKTYLTYDVNLGAAASYFEQAVDALRSRTARPSGNPARDAFEVRRLDAEATVVEDYLAYAYHAAKITDPTKNRFVAAEPNPKVTFADVTEAAGLKGVAAPRVAVGDFDNDGLEDLCACGRIFRNVDGKTFKEVTKELGVDPEGIIAALWLDYDNDGNLDLLCASFPKVRLYRNPGKGGRFLDVTVSAGLDYAFPGPPEALAVCDYDGDGYLDLFVGCFEHPDPRQASVGQPNFLFHNDGTGRFVDVTRGAGMAAGPSYCTRSATWGDFNNDGRPDLYVANYRLNPNQLWANHGGGKFLDEAEALGVRGVPGAGQYAQAFGHSVAATWGDVDNDGHLDLAVCNIAFARFLEFADPSALYRNGGKKDGWRFTDIIEGSGIRFQEMASDFSLCDVDNDGDLDLLVTAIYKERPTALYMNVGGNKFQAVTWRSGLLGFNAWGIAWFDKDNDGDMDVALGGAGGIRLFENQATDTSWLRVQLIGRKSNRLGIGSRVSVTAGALSLIREVTCGSGATSQNSPVAHFGLGSHKGTADITVRWPDGREQRVAASPINRLVKIEEQ